MFALGPHLGPKMAQNSPKRAQDGPKEAQDGPKMEPEWKHYYYDYALNLREHWTPLAYLCSRPPSASKRECAQGPDTSP